MYVCLVIYVYNIRFKWWTGSASTLGVTIFLCNNLRHWRKVRKLNELEKDELEEGALKSSESSRLKLKSDNSWPPSSKNGGSLKPLCNNWPWIGHLLLFRPVSLCHSTDAATKCFHKVTTIEHGPWKFHHIYLSSLRKPITMSGFKTGGSCSTYHDSLPGQYGYSYHVVNLPQASLLIFISYYN